jgi:hypothetical protein
MRDTKKTIKEIIKKYLENILLENIQEFDNWRMPSLEQLKLEYKVEDVLKGNNFWESEDEFLEAVADGRVLSLSSEEDYNVGYRSRTRSKESLISLLKSYKSWGKYRTNETVEAIYDGFKENRPMDLPIVVEFKNGRKRIFSGNTRLDVAFQLGITPEILLIKSKENYY